MIGQLYFYRLLLKNGKKKSGIARFVVARDFSVLLWLERRHRAVVLSLHRLPVWLGHFLFAFGKLFLPSIGADELSGLLRDLGLMLKSGIPLIDGLATIKDETRFGESGGAVMAAGILHSELEGGATVSQAFSRHPDLFPEIVCHLVEIGNESGTLDRMLLEASGHLDRMALIGRNVRQALIYPVFVFAVIIGAAAFWIYYVIPNLSELFRQLHAKMPPLTLAVMRFADWLAAHGVLSLLILLTLVLTPWLCFRYSEKARRNFYHLGHRLPISGLLLRVSGMAFLAEHLGLLVRAGLNIVQSLQILERATSDEYYRESIAQARRVIERGEHLSVAMRATGRFPSLALRMISVGENTGTLDDQLAYLAGEYRQRLTHLVASISEIIKPVIILIAGGFFIFVIAVVLLPVYDLIRQAMTMPGF